MSNPSNKAATRAAEEKAKKQKKILAVTSVVLLAVVGFQLPRLMGGHGSSSAAPPVDTSVLPSAPSAPVPGADGTLPDTDHVGVQPSSSQLVSFGLFKSKDPFIQQVGTDAAPLPGTPTPAPAPTPAPQTLPTVSPPATTTTPHPRTTPATPVIPSPVAPVTPVTPVTTTTPVVTSPITPTTTPVATPSSPSPVPTPKPTTQKPAPTSAAIATNNVCEVVNKNGTFPSDQDIFRLVSIAKDGKSVKIGVVGGAYDSGAATVTLELGKKLTLVNTADGTRYVIVLKSHCDTESEPVGGGTGTTVPTSTVAPPTTTSSATTPIVTDSLDTTTPTP